MSLLFHGRYLELVAEIESRFAVAGWKTGDADLWPPARMDLYLDMYHHAAGSAPPGRRGAPLRMAAHLARPARNLWRSRRDLSHTIVRPRPAHAVFLGDGVSLDRVDGHWQDRHGEAVIRALESQGYSTFLMQGGHPVRLPWRRPTFAANLVEAAGGFAALLPSPPPELPDHAEVIRFLAERGVPTPSLAWPALVRRGRELLATAWAFGRVLRKANPRLAFVTTWYAGLGFAFALACRRRGVLCVDLQNTPQGPQHKAYGWARLPARGYTTMPAVFWTWTDADAGNIRRWSDGLEQPWHRAAAGGNPQLELLADDPAPAAGFSDVMGTAHHEREILVALQPIAGHRDDWEALAAQIEASPKEWRWWLRRHPASHAGQDLEFGRLLSIRSPRVLIEQASKFPLPVMLPRMSVLVSLASGAAVEAEAFGIPALFLSRAAATIFPDLIARGSAHTTVPADLYGEIAGLPPKADLVLPSHREDISSTLQTLDRMSQEYSAMCSADCALLLPGTSMIL